MTPQWCDLCAQLIRPDEQVMAIPGARRSLTFHSHCYFLMSDDEIRQWQEG